MISGLFWTFPSTPARGRGHRTGEAASRADVYLAAMMAWILVHEPQWHLTWPGLPACQADPQQDVPRRGPAPSGYPAASFRLGPGGPAGALPAAAEARAAAVPGAAGLPGRAHGAGPPGVAGAGKLRLGVRPVPAGAGTWALNRAARAGGLTGLSTRAQPAIQGWATGARHWQAPNGSPVY